MALHRRNPGIAAQVMRTPHLAVPEESNGV
jgi:hypothetical protein